MSYFKIGFHTGPGGNKNGIGDHWRALDQAGIPATLVAVDEYGPTYELQQLAAASGVAHNILFRFKSKIPNFNPDVPAYHLAPDVAAAHWWQTVRASLPPELVEGDARQYVWLIAGNEVDKQHASWLGEWATHLALLANPDGWRIAAFGWSSGEPELEHWTCEGMATWLAYCAQHPEMAAVALHEYSYTMQLQDGHPYKIGRFWKLVDACRLLGLATPSIYVTEFGWTYDDLPGPLLAMQQLRWAADLYAEADAVKGAAVWYLGGGYGQIANRAQPLIAPVTAAALAYQGAPSQPPAQQEPARLQHTIHLLPQDTSLAELHAVSGYLHNTRSAFTYSHDVVEATMFHSTPGGTIMAWEPQRWDFDLQARFAWLGVKYQPRSFSELGQQPGLVVHDIVNELPRHATKKYAVRTMGQVDTIVVHHTAGVATPAQIAAYHVNSNDWPGIAYHYIIEADGTTYLTNNLTTVSYHAAGANQYSVGVALIGDFTRFSPPAAQLAAARELVAQLKDKLGTRTVLAHRQVDGSSTACPGATWEEWFYNVAGEAPPAPEAPPGSGTLWDLQVFMGAPGGTNVVHWRGPLYEVQTENAGQQRHQTQVENGITYHTKDHEWEELNFSAQAVLRRTDTSPGNGVYYTLRDADISWSRWAPRFMRVGEWFMRTPTVTFYRKSDCSPVLSGAQSSWLEFVARHADYTFFTGIQLVNVVELAWHETLEGPWLERYWYAQGYGLVAWASHDGRRAAISELHAPGARPDNVREEITCI